LNAPTHDFCIRGPSIVCVTASMFVDLPHLTGYLQGKEMSRLTRVGRANGHCVKKM
jgi:nicotinamidase-related amidase